MLNLKVENQMVVKAAELIKCIPLKNQSGLGGKLYFYIMLCWYSCVFCPFNESHFQKWKYSQT